MKFFDRMTDNFFLVNEKGETIFYPWGKSAKGYLIPSKKDEEKHRKFISVLYLFFFCLIFLLGVTVGWIFGIVLFPAYYLSLFLWVRISTKRLAEAPPASQIRLGWLIYCCCLVLLLIIGTIKDGLDESFNGPLDIIDRIMAMGALSGLFLYSVREKLLAKRYGQLFCLIFIPFDAIYNIFIEPNMLKHESFALQKNLIAFPLILPLYIALYLYAFKFMSNEDAK